MPDATELLRTAIGHHQSGRLDQADAIYARILRIDPDHVDALHLSGLVAHQRGRVIDAVERVGRAVRLRPAEPGFRFNYGNVLVAAGRDVDAFLTAVALKPDFVDAMNNLANALERLKRDAELLEVRKKITAARPGDAEARLRLARLFHRLKQLDSAVTEYQAAVGLSPNLPDAQENLAISLQSLGRTAEAVAIFENLIPPADVPVKLTPAVHSNLMLALQYSDSATPTAVFEAHQRWARAHLPPQVERVLDPDFDEPSRVEAQTPRQALPAPGPAADRRLRIGYVSADFWDHPVGRFIRPLIEGFDRSRFDCFCYDHSETDDRVTRSLRASATQWRPAQNTSDAQLVKMIRGDRIDILVDLSGHTAGHRLTAFAQKPAPVQVTYLGYPGTTGVPGIDYRLTDPIADPPGMTDRLFTEKLFRLGGCFLCYTPPADAPAVAAAPAESNGHATFGSFNASGKISPATVRLWASVLNAVPTSGLVLKAIGWTGAGNRRRIESEFAGHGIDPARIEFLPPDTSWSSHMGRYGRIDLALDPFPYHGTTTTCEALWMGVPTITLAGTTHVSRVGATVNFHAGVGEFTAADEAAFVGIARGWAADADRLRSLRASLRERVRASVLCDGPAFVAEVQRAFERMAGRG